MAERHHFFRRYDQRHVVLVSVLVVFFIMLLTPKVSHSPNHHLFADMRNFLGVPNTMNVLTCFPFLLIGVPSLVICLSGTCFGISLKGEMWSWGLFYAGISLAAFGSAYYHLNPDDDRIIWDKIPVMIATVALISSLVIERVDEKTGVTCLISLIALIFVSVACESQLQDL